jgi:tetratricopeptide (TPR) repeat protein
MEKITSFPVGIFQNCTNIDIRPRESHPYLYTETALGVYRRGVEKYVQKEYVEALALFRKSFKLDLKFAGAPFGQAFTLMKLQCFEDAFRIFSKLPSGLTFPTAVKLLNPPEWTGCDNPPRWALESAYYQAHKLYCCGAVKEALQRLSIVLEKCPQHILSLDLKFKCLLEFLTSPETSNSLGKCGAQLKAFTIEPNIKAQNLLPEDVQMVQETIRRHLKFSENVGKF